MQLSWSGFWTSLFGALAVYRQENLDPGNTKHNDVRNEYDFVIVGAGAAGSIVANRLSENSSWRVLLIEAGGPETHVSNVPFLIQHNIHTDLDWNYTTVKQQKVCLANDGECEYPRGHALGGSTAINYMMYARGHRKDYDDWEKMGCSGWSYDKILPYFIKSEKNRIPRFQDSPYHGTQGYQDVQYPRYTTRMRDEYIRAGREFGWQFRDYNGPNNDNTIDYIQYTMRGADRASVSKTYLLPIMNRTNIDIIQRSMVSKIIIENRRATGVEYYREGVKYTVKANKEVIVSAGAINTPKLLMLSGIGPKEQLQKFGIPLIVDLPVGKGLQDHAGATLFYKINKPYTVRGEVWQTNQSIHQYAELHRGPLSTTGAEVVAYFNPRNGFGVPSFQMTFTSSTFIDQEKNENYLQISGTLVHCRSRGSVRLRSANYSDPPLIDPNYLGDDYDFVTMELGLKTILDFMETPTMAKHRPELTMDLQPKCRGLTGRNLIRCLICQHSSPFYHAVSSARMGDPGDNKTVVSTELKVLHVNGLRVIDASVMPAVPRGNTACPTTMVAEKGAALVKEAYA